MSVTTEQANDLMARIKRITQPIVWKPRIDRVGHEVDVAVGFLNPETSLWELGRLKAVAVPRRKVKCALLYGSVPLRRLCNAHGSYHKHRWKDGNQRDAYVPDDLRPEVYDGHPDEALIDFLQECGIDFSGSLQRTMLWT